MKSFNFGQKVIVRLKDGCEYVGRYSRQSKTDSYHLVNVEHGIHVIERKVLDSQIRSAYASE